MPRSRSSTGPRQKIWLLPQPALDLACATRENKLVPEVDEARVKQAWASRGFSCDLWVDPPGRVWKDFVHGVDELVMMLEGVEEFEIDGKIHRLRIGEELLIPAHAYHTARNVGKTTAKWLYGYKRN